MKKIISIFFAFFMLAVLSGWATAEPDNEYKRALQYYNSGQYEEAAGLFKEYVKKKPIASAYYRAGYALYKLGKRNEAVKYFDEAYLIDPDFSTAMIDEQPLQGIAPGKLRMPVVTAEEPVMPEAAVQADPEYKRALQYYNSGQYEEAAGLFKEYVKKKPIVSAYYRAGYALYKLGRFNEAMRYFDQAYLVNQDFSPVLLRAEPSEKIKPEAPAGVMSPSKKELKKLDIEDIAVLKEEALQEKLAEEAAKKSQPVPAQMPAVIPAESATQKKEALPDAVPQPEITFEPPVDFSESPGDKALLTGIIASIGIFVVFIGIAFYIYYSLCLFRIAKRLDVSSAWTAWVPIIQVWAFISSAGKAWWWILLLLIPGAHIIVMAYLWMCVTENLGRNKWLGLLILLPVVNLIWIGYLAFSASE